MLNNQHVLVILVTILVLHAMITHQVIVIVAQPDTGIMMNVSLLAQMDISPTQLHILVTHV
jgi:hypothetical protein